MAGRDPLLSGLILWTKRMALILLGSKRLATFWTRKRINTMRHDNSVLHQILKHIPWAEFERLVEERHADKHVRRLTTKGQLIAMLYAQLSGAASLREIEAGLKSHEARLYHVGAGPVRRSTLADANFLRPAEIFAELFAAMMKQAHRGLRRALADTTYLIDSTGLRLDERSAHWARFSAGVCGAKLHVIHDADADCPIYAAISQATQDTINGTLAFARMIRINLMHRRRIDQLLEPDQPLKFNQDQMALQWT
jgi:hypothetical protein